MPDFKFSEGATPLDTDEAAGLLLSHITTRGEFDRWEQGNIINAHLWLDKTKPKDILNEQFIRELHWRMFGDVWRCLAMGRFFQKKRQKSGSSMATDTSESKKSS